MLTFEKNGDSKCFPVSKAPKDDYGYMFTNISIIETPSKNYKPPNKSRLKEARIEVNGLSSGEFIGRYKSNSTTGRYVAIVRPGRHEILVEAEGYSPFKKIVRVLGKSSYKEVIKKDLSLEPNKEPAPIPYVELPVLVEKVKKK